MSYAEEEMLRALGAGLDRLQAASTETINRPLILPKSTVQVLDSIGSRKLSSGQVGNYLLHGGIHCPDCLSHQISGGSVDINEGRASQEVSCTSCGLVWWDDYQLVGISDVKFAPPKGREGTVSSNLPNA
jgi:hypothetical protein